MNDLVRDGYDRIARAYAEQRDQFKNERHLDILAARLRRNSRVLDVGCGSGEPIDRYLLDRGFAVTGIDISSAQVALARSANPDSVVEVRDMLDLRPGEYSVDAIVSFYTIFHAPRETHAGLFATLRSFLPVGGLLLVTMGADDWHGVEEFHGVEMAWSHFGALENRRLVERAGFAVELDEIDESGGERHQIILARAI
jgi:cyclopropane fatty-acyl-phospholipid synthase-like methyltransferase